MSSLLKALVESGGESRFLDGREVELKGLAGTVDFPFVPFRQVRGARGHQIL